jgi:hypothetical protein
MIDHEFERAEEMVERLGNRPALLDDTSLHLIEGVDYVCRPLDSVVRSDLPHDTWIRYTAHNRQNLWASYKTLGESSEVLRMTAGLSYPRLGMALGGGDLYDMAVRSGHAQFTANRLATYYDDYAENIHTPYVIEMAMAAVKAVVAWKPEGQSFGIGSGKNYERNLRIGLVAIDRLLWADD